MKFDNLSRLLWSVTLALIATASTSSNVLVSSAPIASFSSGTEVPIPTIQTAIPADRPGSYPTQVDHTVATQVFRWNQGERDDEDFRHLIDSVMECYVDTPGVKIYNRAKPGVKSVEEEKDFETEGDVKLSKRRMQVYGAIRYVNPADIRRRDHPSAFTTITSEKVPEEGAALFKRRMRKSGQIQTVHPDDYMKRDLPFATTTPEDEPKSESKSESESESKSENGA